MENWENNLLANKLNSLQELPAGYSPNLSSKWEIVEAGLPPQKKRRMVPVVLRWSVAAALLLAMGLVWMNWQPKHVDTYTNSLGSPVIKDSTHRLAKASPFLAGDDTNQGIERTPERVTASSAGKNARFTTDKNESIAKSSSNSVVANPNNDTIAVSKPLQKETTTTESNELVQLPISRPDTLSSLSGNNLTVAATEKLKPAKRKVYQRDFNDGVLTMDTGFTTTTSQHFSIKLLPFSRKNINGDEQPARHLQLKQLL